MPLTMSLRPEARGRRSEVGGLCEDLAFHRLDGEQELEEA